MGAVIFDSQFDEENGILRNSLGITEAEELEQHIARLSFVRVIELEASPLRGHFDIAHLRAVHRYIFQDVFPWAGEFREVTTSRTNSFSFPPPQFLVPSLDAIFASLRSESFLTGLGRERFAFRAAHYLGEINAVHPFREGNGRAQREFIRTLALHAGHRLVWSGLTQQENDSASRLSFATGGNEALAEIIRRRLV